MEKHTAHCKLETIKGLIAADKVRATVNAANTATEVGVNSLAEMCNVIMGLTRTNFIRV